MTKEEQRISHNDASKKWRRKKRILPKKHFTEEERKEGRKQSQEKWSNKNLNYKKDYYQKNKKGIKAKQIKYCRMKGILPKTKLTKEERKNRKNEAQKIYYQTHKEERKLYDKKYYQDNKEKLLEYHQNRKDITNQQVKNRLKTDPNFKLAHYLRSRLRKAIKGNYKSGSAVRDLGCTIPELKTRLESMFQPGMTWDNWSIMGWHIDHIIPLDSFNLSDREQFLKAVHFTNLQPLWAEENHTKSNKKINL